MGLDEIVRVDLSDEERSLLIQGLSQWGGPARPSDAVAQVIGFESVDSMHLEGPRIRRSLDAGKDLTRRDLQRALVATEIVWSSNFYGAAFDWEIVSTWDDARTLRVLRDIQRKVLWLRNPPRRVDPTPRRK